MRLSNKEAREFGIDVPKKAGRRKQQRPPAAPALFLALCRAHGLPEPVPEFYFHPERKWRFDWLFDGWLALEVEGGAWTQGRHTRGAGFLGDVQKYNAAALLGYTVLRCTPQDVESGAACELVKRAMEAQ